VPWGGRRCPAGIDSPGCAETVLLQSEARFDQRLTQTEPFQNGEKTEWTSGAGLFGALCSQPGNG